MITSERRLLPRSMSVNWFTANQSLFSGMSKSMSRACVDYAAIRCLILDWHASDEASMKATVVREQVCTLDAQHLL